MAKNSAALFVVAILTKGAGLVVAVLIARHLGPAALGTYATVMSISLLLENIAPLGLPFVIIREVARDRTRLLTYWLNTSLMTLLFSLLLGVALVVIVYLIGEGSVILTLTYIVALYLPVAGLYAIARAIVQGLEQMEHLAISAFAGRGLGLLTLGILLQMGVGIVAAFVGYGLFVLVAYLILVRAILRLVGKSVATSKAHLDLKLGWATLRVSYLFAIQTLLMRASLLVSVLVLPMFVTMETVGIFDAADRVPQTSTTIIPIVTAAILPTLSRNFLADREKAIALLETALKLLQVVTLPFVFIVAIAADQIVPLLYGPRYEATVSVLQIVIWAQIFFVADAVFNQVMMASDNERAMIQRTATSLGANVILILVLAPHYGAIGAAWAVVVARMLNLVLDTRFVFRRITPINLVETIGKPLLCAVLSGGIALTTRSYGLWASVILFIGSYAALLWSVRVFDADELNLARQLSDQLRQRVFGLRKH